MLSIYFKNIEIDGLYVNDTFLYQNPRVILNAKFVHGIDIYTYVCHQNRSLTVGNIFFTFESIKKRIDEFDWNLCENSVES